MTYKPGPKELQVKALREGRAAKPSREKAARAISEATERTSKPKPKKRKGRK